MSGHESQQNSKPRKSKKRLFNFGGGKWRERKHKKQQDIVSEIENKQESEPNVHVASSPSDHNNSSIKQSTKSTSTPMTTSDVDDNQIDEENDEICQHVANLTNILNRLKTMCYTHNTTHHTMTLERFQKLIKWVELKESHMKLLEAAWNDAHFWPFIETAEAEQLVEERKDLLVIRLSNSKNGAISVTRTSKGLNQQQKWADFVKHKRYCHVDKGTEGKLVLQGSWGQRYVTWHGLVAHLKQNECCICLEDLANKKVLRLNCGHHFHKLCIEKHVQHSPHQNCPLCRSPIKNADLIQEPTVLTYKKMPSLHHSKSVQEPKEMDDFGGLERAATFHSTPTDEKHHDPKFIMTPNDENEAVPHDWNQMANNLQRRHTHNSHGNHLNVAWSGGIDEDEYGNAAQAAQLATKLIATSHDHH